MPAMTRSNYIAIGSVLAKLREDGGVVTLDKVAEALANEFARDDPKFHRERFILSTKGHSVSHHRDGLYVFIEDGDRVVVSAWGYGATKNDVGQEGEVVGLHRTRVSVKHSDGTVKRYAGSELHVLRRDGEPGKEGNKPIGPDEEPDDWRCQQMNYHVSPCRHTPAQCRVGTGN